MCRHVHTNICNMYVYVVVCMYLPGLIDCMLSPRFYIVICTQGHHSERPVDVWSRLSILSMNIFVCISRRGIAGHRSHTINSSSEHIGSD